MYPNSPETCTGYVNSAFTDSTIGFTLECQVLSNSLLLTGAPVKNFTVFLGVFNPKIFF
jgi:hypothetical protein